MSARFEIILSKQAAKYYQRLPVNLARRFDRAFMLLEDNPFHGVDVKLLKNLFGRYRMRIGDLRVIYQINKVKKQVLISTILPRGDVYKE